MKYILRPEKHVPEKAAFSCDFSNFALGDSAPNHVEIWCGYGSDRDGVRYHFHLCNEALEDLMAYLRLRMFPRKTSAAGFLYIEERPNDAVSGPEDAMKIDQLREKVRAQCRGMCVLRNHPATGRSGRGAARVHPSSNP
ncbi:hypothetical protein OpiT1DRAFT_03379 [Opitutaceae bacterium TAV1]|nr:hypothetical protein OpiT1DRAFT_03379 [Opitutaceae bacterium TAV1]